MTSGPNHKWLTRRSPVDRGYQRHFFTFRSTHIYARFYVEIHAKSAWTAKRIMQSAHGDQWELQYSELQFEGHIELFDYQRLSLIVLQHGTNRALNSAELRYRESSTYKEREG